ncbi:MAG: contractile injection system tape measure protein, partial [Bacteroidota bacterium]
EKGIGQKQSNKSLTRPQQEKRSATSTIYVDYAGLILIAPFLPTYFGALDLLKEEQFVSQFAREKAVHLLYFLATGKEKPSEPETLFFKFLCGLPFQFPIQKELDLTDTEKMEGEHLLTSAISHWKKLKKTSVNGLREGFFRREGKLIVEKEHYKLIVEQRGVDVLLGYLPWRISTIKLPWLEDSIRVDWA